MIFSLFFICADHPKASKVNRLLYPPGITMENLISSIKHKGRIQTTKTFFGWKNKIKDHCKWKGVDCEKAKVHSIDWSGMRLGGSLSMQWIPQLLNYLNAEKNILTGEIALSCFPEVIETIILANNRLSGTVDLENMQTSVKRFNISANQFQGGFDMQTLPKGWKPHYINISMNTFSGGLDFAFLPRSVSSFYAIWSRFSGSVRLVHLGECLCLSAFSIRSNAFSGDIDLNDVTFVESLSKFDISQNNFTGEVHLETLLGHNVRTLSLCDISLNKLTVNGKSAPWVEPWDGLFTGQQGEPDAPMGPRRCVAGRWYVAE